MKFWAQVVLYSSIMSGVMVYSGKDAEKTIYDISVVSGEGVVIHTTDPVRAANFYQRVLDLKPIRKEQRLVGIELPGRQKIFFEHRSHGANPDPTEVIVRVRSRIGRLWQAILARSSTPPYELNQKNLDYDALPSERISSLSEQSWGEEFAVADPDGNKVIFVMPYRRSGSRY